MPRAVWLELDPLEAARRLVQTDGLNSIVRETVVPQIQTGAHSILVTANLPGQRPGVLECGVTLRAAPHPPFRAQAISETVLFDPPEDSANVLLRLSPFEELRYSYATFVITQTRADVERQQSDEVAVEADRLELNVSDFPVDFASVEASRALLDAALIKGVCRAKSQGTVFEQRFELSTACSAVALAFPKGSSDFAVHVDAQALQGTGVLGLDPPWNGGLSLDLPSFREYGAHKVRIECQLVTEGMVLAAIDLLAEGAAETIDQISVVHFTAAASVKEWTYLAMSPFHAGYRYRMHPNSGDVPAPWSDVQSPFDTLVIKA